MTGGLAAVLDPALEAWVARWGRRATDASDPVAVEVESGRWFATAESARDDLGFTWFDTLTVVDEGDGRFTVLLHLVRRGTPLTRLALRAELVDDAIASVAPLWPGASWHEREQAEMFGVAFDGAPDPRRLLLPGGFDGAPLRKDFVLAARAARPWPGVKEPGESDADMAAASSGASEPAASGARSGRRRRRRAVPPGVPERDQDGAW